MQSSQPMKDFVTGLLKNKIPAAYYYHNCEHTLYVADKVIEIGQHENCTARELDLLVAAALWHDAGFINVYNNHEKESCLLAQKYLPQYGYAAADINTICGMIMATKMPQSPHNKLEQIIADADLEYLGTAQADAIAENLFKELQLRNASFSREQWYKTQLSFLQNHQYFTRYCKEYKTPLKYDYLQRLTAAGK